MAVEKSGAVIVRKCKSGPTPKELLSRITPESFPDETDWCEPLGKELW